MRLVVYEIFRLLSSIFQDFLSSFFIFFYFPVMGLSHSYNFDFFVQAID